MKIESSAPRDVQGIVRQDGAIVLKTASGCLVFLGGEKVGYWATREWFDRWLVDATGIFVPGDTLTITF